MRGMCMIKNIFKFRYYTDVQKNEQFIDIATDFHHCRTFIYLFVHYNDSNHHHVVITWISDNNRKNLIKNMSQIYKTTVHSQLSMSKFGVWQPNTKRDELYWLYINQQNIYLCHELWEKYKEKDLKLTINYLYIITSSHI